MTGNAEERKESMGVLETQQLGLRKVEARTNSREFTVVGKDHVRDLPVPDQQEIVGILQISDTEHGLRRSEELVEEVLIVGRHECCSTLLHCSLVSRQHFKLEHRRGHWQITDLESTNGTYLDRKRLEPNHAYPWLPGQVVEVGRYSLVLEVPTRPNDFDYVTYLGTEIAQGKPSFGLELDSPAVALFPGDSGQISIRCDASSEPFDIQIEGIPESWFSLDGQSLVIHPAADAEAGQYSLSIIGTRGCESCEAQCNLEVLQRPDIGVELEPGLIELHQEAVLTLENRGTSEEILEVSVSADESLELTASNRFRRLQPGARESVTLAVQSARRPLFGRAQEKVYEVAVTGPLLEELRKQGGVLVRSRFSAKLSAVFLVSLVWCGVLLSSLVDPAKLYNQSLELMESIQSGETVAAGDTADVLQSRIDRLAAKIDFDPGSSELSEPNRKILNSIVFLFSSVSAAKVRIVGHTDATGSRETNKKLALERARKVAAFVRTSLGSRVKFIPEYALNPYSSKRGVTFVIQSSSTS